MKAKVGTRDVCSLSKIACPIRAIARAWSRLTILANPERSAPAARMNGLPVMAIANTSSRRERGVQCAIQFPETAWAQGIGSLVITSVVQRDQHRGPRCVWQLDVPAQRPGDDLALAPGRGLGDQLLEFLGPHVPPRLTKWGFSQITVPPMPRPMHSVVRP